MQVTVHLAPQVAREIKLGAPESGAAREIMSVAKEMGVELRALHPGSTDPGMASTFVVEASDEEAAERIAARLRDLPGTEAAYVKPPPAPP
jgi:hypothetical protein